MYSLLFGAVGFLILCGVWVVLYKTYCSIAAKDSYLSRRERNIVKDNKVVSLKQSIANELLRESLEINLKQVRLNELVLSGDLSEKVQKEMIILDYDREALVKRSLQIGLTAHESNKSINIIHL